MPDSLDSPRTPDPPRRGRFQRQNQRIGDWLWFCDSATRRLIVTGTFRISSTCPILPRSPP